MFNTDLYVIAAGNGSRLGAHVPKALLPIGETHCLTATLRLLGHLFRQVFVVTNLNLKAQWNDYFRELAVTHPGLAATTSNLPIKSGLGDGHATLQGILLAERTSSLSLTQEIVIVWGDVVFLGAEIIEEMLTRPCEGSGLIPAVRESEPYVSLLVDDRMRCMSADFSKHGENHSIGLHDQSVFRFNRRDLRRSLQSLHDALWKGGRYLTPAGELSLLYSFHQLYNSGEPSYVYETAYRTLCFNTVDELKAIRRKLEAQNSSDGQMIP